MNLHADSFRRAALPHEQVQPGVTRQFGDRAGSKDLGILQSTGIWYGLPEEDKDKCLHAKCAGSR
jgi:hypothetical protein